MALGTAQFGLNYGIVNQRGQVCISEASSIIRTSRDLGINTLDTAIGYGDSEQLLGRIGVGNWRVVSKLPAIPNEFIDNPKPWIKEVIDGSLKRLNTPVLYALLLHRPEQLLGEKGALIFRELQRLKDDGLVVKIGVSVYSPEELESLCEKYDFDIVQVPFNIFDRRLIATDWLNRMVRLGIEIHVRSVFLQGLLLANVNSRPKKFLEWNSLWAVWDDWLVSSKQSPLETCLNYVLSFPQVSQVIFGVDSFQQFKEITSAVNRPIPALFPEIKTNDLRLLNPAHWPFL